MESWKYEPEYERVIGPIPDGDENSSDTQIAVIAQIHTNSPADVELVSAHGHLIAAAPDLLAALKCVIAWWEESIDDNAAAIHRKFSLAANAARAAIAKAEGGES